MVFVDYKPMTSYILYGLLVYIFVIVAENNNVVLSRQRELCYPLVNIKLSSKSMSQSSPSSVITVKY